MKGRGRAVKCCGGMRRAMATTRGSAREKEQSQKKAAENVNFKSTTHKLHPRARTADEELR